MEERFNYYLIISIWLHTCLTSQAISTIYYSIIYSYYTYIIYFIYLWSHIIYILHPNIVREYTLLQSLSIKIHTRIIICFSGITKERIDTIPLLIGILWLCTGNDRLDVLPLGSLHSRLRGLLRRGAGLDPLDDHGRALLPRSKTCSHVNSRAGQLDGQFPCRNSLPNYEGLISNKEPLKWVSYLHSLSKKYQHSH